MPSRWNRYLDRVIDAGPSLTQNEHRLAIVLVRSILGWNEVEQELGEELLRKTTRLHGRSFARARDGLVTKGLIEYIPPTVPGRGHRGRYRLVLGRGDPVDASEETPAARRDFRAVTSPAAEREIRPETPAETPAQSPALARARIEEGVKNVVVDDELDGLLSGFDPASARQRHLFAEALRTNPSGFRACVNEAQRGQNPIALLTSLIRDEAHLATSAPMGSAELLERWLEGDGQRFDDETASEVLTDSFGLAGEDHAQALRRWRERHRRAADDGEDHAEARHLGEPVGRPLRAASAETLTIGAVVVGDGADCALLQSNVGTPTVNHSKPSEKWASVGTNAVTAMPEALDANANRSAEPGAARERAREGEGHQARRRSYE